MSCRSGFVAGVILAVACMATAPAPAGLPISDPGIPQSCGVQLKNHNFATADLQKVRSLGFRIIRKGIYWDAVEKAKGAYDFAVYDRLMRDAKDLGLTVVACLFSGNTLYEDDGQDGIQTDAGRKGFAAFAAALAGRYKGRDVIWEIWNEPNVRTFWRKNGKHNSDEFAGEYTALVKAVVPPMLAADPNCFVVAGSVSNYWEPSYQWTESCFRKGMLKTGIRGWSVHPYGVKTPEEFAIGHGRTRALLRRYGVPKGFPILNTERGFAVKETGEGWSGGPLDRAREFQAWHFVRQYMVDQLHGVRLTVWYEWSGEKFGLVDGDANRPVATAGKVMLEQLGGYRLAHRVATRSALDYVLLFEDGRGGSKLVAWTAPPPKQSADKAVPHDVPIETGVAGPYKVADLHGRERSAEGADGKLVLGLTGAPQYVTLPAGAKLTAYPVVTYRSQGLRLFDKGAAWAFQKNTGEGSFVLRLDGNTPVGVLRYDFSKSRPKPTPYVLAVGKTHVPAGAIEVRLQARSRRKQRLTFRVIDDTGQVHQYKTRIEGSGSWEPICIPLTKRLEHWDGAKDGHVHFPIRSMTLNVPQPPDGPKTGEVEYADAVVELPDK